MALFGRGKSNQPPIPLKVRESDVSASEVAKDFRTVFGEDNLYDLVRLPDGYAWIYHDGRKTKVCCLGEEWCSTREAYMEERLDLGLSGPSLVRMLARDAVELSSVNQGLDSNMDPGFQIDYSRAHGIIIDKERCFIRLDIKDVYPPAKIYVPPQMLDLVSEYISARIPGS